MSGHSKWAQIKRQKGKADVKRGLVFTKLANAITITVKQGGGVTDPSQNFRLRLAIESARALNMPKENIERAIGRALRKEAGEIEEVLYEGFAPSGVALIIKAATDNKNRTTSEIKGIMERSGGTFASVGSVSWMFKDEGLINVLKNGKSFDEIFEIAAGSGAEDIREADDTVEIYTKPNELYVVKNFLEEKGLTVQNEQLYKNPTSTVEVKDSETAKKILLLIEKLEELDDVQNVYSNLEIPDRLLESIKS